VQREGRPVVYVRLGATEDIDKSLDELELGVDGSFQGGSNNPAEFRHILQHLYSLVLAPLETSLKGVSRLLVIPDGRLSLIPLGGLMNDQGHYFLESHIVTYLNSKILNSQTATPSPPVVVANPDFDVILTGSPQAPLRNTLAFRPLPGAEREAHYVAEMLHLPADRVLTGRNAREELLHSIRSPEILHLATHSDPFLQARLPADQFTSYDLFEFPSLLLAQDPFLHSVIALAGANRPQAGTEDGLLTGLEVASLHLAGTRLVVLSSCQSANGKLVDGQGIPGLRAAFSAAGARSLLMNLWPVDDEAGFEFMKFFYSHLALGAAQAMHQAQLHMLNDTQYKNPLYWAGYTYSDNEALIPDTSRPKPSAPTPVVTAAMAPTQEVPIAPRCFQLTGHAEEFQGLKVTVRIKLDRVVRNLDTDSRLADKVAVYDMHLPENDISVVREVNGKPVPYDTSAYKSEAATLIIQKAANSSGMIIRTSAPFFQIFLQGPPMLFPSLVPPETLPALSAYSAATANSLDGAVKIDTIGACSPLKQNDERANGTKRPHTPIPASGVSTKSAGSDNPRSIEPAGETAAPPAKVSAADIPAFQKLEFKPRCFQLSGVSHAYPDIAIRFTARITLTTARTMQISGNGAMAYDLSLPGNEITIIPEVNGKPAEGGVSVVGAEKSFAEKSFLVISRDADSSTFSLKIGNSQPPSYIGLKGPPDLFPKFDIPETLPPLRLYREASIHLQGEEAKVDTVGVCGPEPQQQNNDGRITVSSPQTPVSSEGVATKSAASHSSILSTEAPATGAPKTVPSVQAGGEMLIAPRCFQLSGVSSTTPKFTTRFTARITLGGVVRKLVRAEQLAIYDIHLPGNEVAIVYDINGTQTADSYSLSMRDGLTLTVRRTGLGSGIFIRTADGDTTTEWIVMEGLPDLFPTVDIPETLPSLSSFTQALVHGGRADSIGFCGPEPLVRYNDGKFRINRSVPSEANSGAGTNSATAPVTGSGSKSVASVTGAGPKSGTAIPSSDQNSGIARQILAFALRGESQDVFKHLTPDADKGAIGAMVGFLSGSANKLGNCPVEGIEVHKILWVARSGRSAPAYVVIGDCEKARPRLLLFMDNNGLVYRTGTGGIISKTTSDQIKQRAQNLAESLLRGDFAAFAGNFSSSMPPQFQNVSAIINSAVQNLGSFEKILASKTFPYADVVVVTAVYQRGTVNVEISFDPALKIAAWYAQTADKPGYFWQEFRDLQGPADH
jgi:CHAT domain-containing protein